MADYWRSNLFSRHSPAGGFHVQDASTHPGTIWYVDSVNGTDGGNGYGLAPGVKALASLAYLITNAATLNGGLNANDEIILAPGHTEDIAAAQITIVTTGLHIHGLDPTINEDRPRFTFSDAAASIQVSNCWIILENIDFQAAITSVLIGVEFTAGVTDCRMQGCRFLPGADGAGADEFIVATNLTDGNDYTTIKDTIYYNHDTCAQSTHAINIAAASNYYVFENLTITGPWATGGIVEAAACLEVTIKGCYIDVNGTDISLDAASTVACRRDNWVDGLPEVDDALGIRRIRASSTIAQTGVLAKFTIAGGRVLVTAIVGEVDTANIGANASNLSLEYNPTAGITQVLCAATAHANDTIGTLYGVTGDPNVALIKAGAVMAPGIIMDAGTIDERTTGNNTGQIQWTCWWKPIDVGATLVVA